MMSAMKKWKLLFLLLLTASVFFTGCLKESEDPNDDETIILFGEEGYIKGFTEVFGTNALDSITVDTNGIWPPDIRGEFEFADRQLVHPAGAFENPNDKVYFRFGDGNYGSDYLHGQNHMIVHCDIKIPGLGLDADVFRTDTAYVSGTGSRFTVYLERTQKVPDTPLNGKIVKIKLSQGIAITGKRADNHSDITDARIALYNKDIQVLNPEEFASEELAPIFAMKGLLFVYKDSDNKTVYNTGNHPYINWND